jgi:hypothetical protein
MGPIIPSSDWRAWRGRRESFVTRLVAAHAGGDEGRLVRGLAGRIPFSLAGDPARAERALRPLPSSVLWGVVSERRLAQESGRWVTIPG